MALESRSVALHRWVAGTNPDLYSQIDLSSETNIPLVV